MFFFFLSNIDDYVLHVHVSNRFDKIVQFTKISVRHLLKHLVLSSSTLTPIVNQTLLLEASTIPPTEDVIFLWDFGDNTTTAGDIHRQVRHRFVSVGVYNLTLHANNSLSALSAWIQLEVVEEITGLSVGSSGLSELSSATEFTAEVSTGTSLVWDFDFGDGSLQGNLTSGFTSHIYMSAGNYTAQVSVSNPVSQARQSIHVEVFRLTVDAVLPAECVMSSENTELSALVNGNISTLAFHWLFGDDSVQTVVIGGSTVTHTFKSQGYFHIHLTVFSPVTSVSYNSSICVETRITDVEVLSSKNPAAAGEQVCFRVLIHPQHITGCHVEWFSSSSYLTSVTENTERCFVFKDEGIEEVSVTVSNNVSSRSSKAAITIQTAVGNLSVVHNGEGDTVRVNATVLFCVVSCAGSDVSVLWDFGDGSATEQKQNVSHVFTTTGEFTVTASTFNTVSHTSATLRLNVLLPVADFSLYTNQSYSVVGEETLITAIDSSGSSTVNYWTVDGISPVQRGSDQFRFTFHEAGVYQVKAQNLASKKEAFILIEVLQRIEGLHIACPSLTGMRYAPTRDQLLFSASVTRGSGVKLHWVVTQSEDKPPVTGDGNVFHLTVESPGRILVQLSALNKLSELTSCVSFEAVERVTNVHMTTKTNILAVGIAVNISVSVVDGSHLEYLWYVDTDASPMRTHVPFLLHTFTSVGHHFVTVSAQNIFSQSNGTKLLEVQEEVEGVDFHINRKKNNFHVKTSAAVSLHGLVLKGNQLHWDWRVQGHETNLFKTSNHTFFYTFPGEGIYNVCLNVSNGVNWQAVSHSVAVLDEIKGLKLNISKLTLCTNDSVTFIPTIDKGSNVSFVLTFKKEDWTHVQDVEGQFTTSGLPAGKLVVHLKAWNKVSSAEESSHLLVFEGVQGLQLVDDCPPALEALKGADFKAKVQSEFPVNYTWIFHSVGSGPLWLKGQHVIFIPPASGPLSFSVLANNGVCSEMLNGSSNIEWAIRKIELLCHSERVFVGYVARFSATAHGGSNVRYQWDFGDSTGVVTEFSEVNHTYYLADEYRVMVRVSNSVSQMSTYSQIKVEQLECSTPQVSLIQRQATILRSRQSLFEASVDNNCSVYRAAYLWEIFRVAHCTENNLYLAGNKVVLHDATSPFLLLPKHSLSVGQYCLTFTVSLQGTPLLVQQKMNVTVGHSALIAVIRGGSHRLWGSSTDLVLDAAESHDPDVEPGGVDALQYHWTYRMAVQNSSYYSSAK